jgi:hypothetical protein
MRRLWNALRGLAGWQSAVIVALVLLVLLTWLAVGLLLTGAITP